MSYVATPGTDRMTALLVRAKLRALRRMALVEDAQEAGRAGYAEEQLAAQARLLVKRLERRASSS